ncbi:hypothetical protein LBMAG53_25820 [Planctomycetota bacterium]|nr:hypothetical protein LBMAG53_25820 [Planctomycetota bacterium]
MNRSLVCLFAVALAVAADEAAAILPTPLGQPGLVVLIGLADPTLPGAVADRSGVALTLACLDRDQAIVDATRVASGKRLGRISAEILPGERLPFLDHAANLVALDAACGISAAEAKRIVAPGGTLAIRTAGTWTRAAQPWPAGYDDWTHASKGVDGNPAVYDSEASQSEALHWLADRPRGLGSYTARLGAGRFLHLTDSYIGTTNPQPKSNDEFGLRRIAGVVAVARDAFNGVTLWERLLPGEGRAQPVIDGDRIWIATGGVLRWIDAATGATRKELPEAGTVLDVGVSGRVLLVQAAEGLRAFSADDGTPMWQSALALPSGYVSKFPKANFTVASRYDVVVAGAGLVFAVVDTDPDPKVQSLALLALDIATGAERWRQTDAELGGNAWPLLVANGVLVVTSGHGVVAIDAATGKRMWATWNAATWSLPKDGGWARQGMPPASVWERPTADLASGKITVDPKRGAIVHDAAGAEVELGAQIAAWPVDDGLILRTAKGLSRIGKDGKTLWKTDFPGDAKRTNAHPKAAWLLVADGAVFTVGIGETASKTPDPVAAFDLATGAKRWSSTVANRSPALLYVIDGAVHAVSDRGITALETTTGELRWQSRPPGKSNLPGQRGGTMGSLVALDGTLWIRCGSNRNPKPNSDDPPLTDLEKRIPAKGWVGLDMKTGSGRDMIGFPTNANWLGRCYGDVALAAIPGVAPPRLLSSAMEFIDLDGSPDFRQLRSTRGVCGTGILPGHGKFFAPPTACMYCYPMLRGANAMGPAPKTDIVIADDQRLTAGPAKDRPLSDLPADWPMYRKDLDRGNCSEKSLDLTNGLSERWVVDLGGRACQPIAAGGRIIATVVDQGTIVALDPASGAERWRYRAGARIDSAPTAWKSLLIFGAHDGCVHAVDLADGALRWRFRAEPAGRRIVAFDQVESSWPVLGALTVRDGSVFAMAGRLTQTDGGLRLYRLDAATGAVQAKTVLTGVGGEKARQRPIPWYEPVDHMPNNLLLPSQGLLRIEDHFVCWYIDPGTLALRDAPGPDRLRYRGFGRITQGYIMAGKDPYPRFDDGLEPRVVSEATASALPKDAPVPVRLEAIGGFTNPRTPQASFWAFPDTTGWGVCARRMPPIELRDKPIDPHCMLFAQRYDQPDLTAAELPWPVQKIDLDPRALLIAGDTVVVAGGLPYAEEHTSGKIVCLGLLDGKERAKADLSAGVVFDGCCVSDGALIVATRDGKVRRLGK